MKRKWLWRVVLITTVVSVLTVDVSNTTVSTSGARAQSRQDGPVFACHGIKKPNCRGILAFFGSALRYTMTASTSFADVETFTDFETPRKVSWRYIVMTGTIGKNIPIEATLDPLRTSTGTVLSVGRREFPATATMQFYFRIETQGIVLISDEPAIFKGTIHAIPPAPGDVLMLVNDQLSFHQQGASGRTMGTLKQSTISFAK